MTTADQKVERAADKLQKLANRLAAEGGLKAKLAEPLAEDADLIRKMKPSLIKARAKGEAPETSGGEEGSTRSPVRGTSRFPRTPSPGPLRGRALRAGPNPWLVVGAALAAGILLAKWIDSRGHAHPRD